MAEELKITPAQCKRARALLKWNPQDLASRTHLSVRHIEKFERNQTKLLRPENEEIVKLFHKNHVDFTKSGEVHLKAPKGGSHEESHESRIDLTLSLSPQDFSASAQAHRTQSPEEKKTDVKNIPKTAKTAAIP